MLCLFNMCICFQTPLRLLIEPLATFLAHDSRMNKRRKGHARRLRLISLKPLVHVFSAHTRG